MNDFLKKLNVLIRANVGEALSPAGTASAGSAPRSPAPLGQEIDREIDRLRQRIDDALAYEDVLRRRLAELDQEIAQWDGQADRAVEAGDDAGGRYAITQMRRVEARHAQLERDLQQHRAAAQEFIAQVEQLEGYVAQQRERATQNQASNSATEVDRQTISDTGNLNPSLAERVRNAVDSVQQAVEHARASTQTARESSPEGGETEQDAPPLPERDLEGDLDRRRQRLQRPTSPTPPTSSSGSTSQ